MTHSENKKRGSKVIDKNRDRKTETNHYYTTTLAEHKDIATALGIDIYFAPPYH